MTSISVENIRAIEFLMATIPGAKQRAEALPHALHLVEACGGDPTEFAYLGAKKSEWSRVNGAHEYLVEFEDGAVHQGDAFTYLVTEREVANLTGLMASSIQQFVQGGKTMRRDTKLGHAVIRRIVTTLTYVDRAKLVNLKAREDILLGPKRSSGRRY